MLAKEKKQEYLSTTTKKQNVVGPSVSQTKITQQSRDEKYMVRY